MHTVLINHNCPSVHNVQKASYFWTLCTAGVNNRLAQPDWLNAVLNRLASLAWWWTFYFIKMVRIFFHLKKIQRHTIKAS